MAITLTLINSYRLGEGGNLLVYTYTGAGSGDTISVGITGSVPHTSHFTDANGNIIVSNPPTFGAWTASGGTATATLTANAGGVVTNGRMVLLTGGF